ncbi:MAG: shikimate kinase [bacterium]|nr:shikimate kinase [bacterium]
MPGSGKSTIGVLLARTLGMSFIDTDLVLQEKERRLLQEIIDVEGLEKFLQIEEQILLGLNLENHVIATGGSSVYSSAAVTHLKKNGRILYLQLEYKEVEERINNITTRGIVMGKGENLFDLYNERKPLYEKYTDEVINCSAKEIEKILGEIKNMNLAS